MATLSLKFGLSASSYQQSDLNLHGKEMQLAFLIVIYYENLHTNGIRWVDNHAMMIIMITMQV